MLDPHESLKLNERRKLLAGGQNNGPWFAIYDVSGDCSHPVSKTSIQLPGSSAHMRAWAPDGMTYYLTQNPQWGPGPLYIVDVSDPSKGETALYMAVRGSWQTVVSRLTVVEQQA